MNIKKILLIAVILSLFVLSKVMGWWDFLTFEYYQNNRDMLLEVVNENYLLSSLLFVLIYIGVTALSIPGATIMTLTGGYIFSYIGVIHVNLGATAGATLAFLASRYIIGSTIQEKYADNLIRLNKEIDENGSNYMLMLRFIFVFPFFLLNLLAGLTKIPTTKFIWTTSLGILPGSMAYIYAGKQLKEINSLSDVLSFNVILAFIFLTIIAILPVLITKLRDLMKSKN